LGASDLPQAINESDYATSDQFLRNKLGGRTEIVAMTYGRENQASAKDLYKEKFKVSDTSFPLRRP